MRSSALGRLQDSWSDSRAVVECLCGLHGGVREAARASLAPNVGPNVGPLLHGTIRGGESTVWWIRWASVAVLDRPRSFTNLVPELAAA